MENDLSIGVENVSDPAQGNAKPTQEVSRFQEWVDKVALKLSDAAQRELQRIKEDQENQETKRNEELQTAITQARTGFDQKISELKSQQSNLQEKVLAADIKLKNGKIWFGVGIVLAGLGTVAAGLAYLKPVEPLQISDLEEAGEVCGLNGIERIDVSGGEIYCNPPAKEHKPAVHGGAEEGHE